MLEKHWLYRIVFPNGKYYFGVSKNPKQRLKTHLIATQKGNRTRVCYAIRKYGKDALKLELLVLGDKNYIYQIEKLAIAHFKTQNPQLGYNITEGGTGSWARSAIENSIKTRKGKPLSLETRAKLSKIRKGRKMPEQFCKRQSALMKGRKVSDETKKKIRNSLLGNKLTVQQRKNCSIAVKEWWAERKQKGIIWKSPRKNSIKLFRHALESKKKISLSFKIRRINKALRKTKAINRLINNTINSLNYAVN